MDQQSVVERRSWSKYCIGDKANCHKMRTKTPWRRLKNPSLFLLDPTLVDLLSGFPSQQTWYVRSLTRDSDSEGKSSSVSPRTSTFAPVIDANQSRVWRLFLLTGNPRSETFTNDIAAQFTTPLAAANVAPTIRLSVFPASDVCV